MFTCFSPLILELLLFAKHVDLVFWTNDDLKGNDALVEGADGEVVCFLPLTDRHSDVAYGLVSQYVLFPLLAAPVGFIVDGLAFPSVELDLEAKCVALNGMGGQQAHLYQS